MPLDYGLPALAAASGVNPEALHARLAAGSPAAIEGIAQGFRAAGELAAAAVTAAGEADQQVAASYVQDGAAVFPAENRTAATREALGAGGERYAEIARAIQEVGGALATHTAAAAEQLSRLVVTLDAIVAARNADIADRPLPPAVAEAVDRRYHADAVSEVVETSRRIQAEIDAYDEFLASRAGRLADLGYATPEVAYEDEEQFPEPGFWDGAAADLGADVANTAASLGNALLNTPEAALGLAGGAAAVVGGGLLAMGGGAVSVTGVGAVAGVPAAAGGAALAGVGVAGIGASLAAIASNADGPDRVEPVRRGQRVPAPDALPGVPGSQRVRPRNAVQGGGALRRRWQDRDRNIYEWDSQHGELEGYDRRGRHRGVFDPETGAQIKPAIPGRTTPT